MRAGRLLRLVMILQDGRRHTAADLAEQVQVSERTVLRDLDALSGAGIPVYATRGPGGGFQLLDTFRRTVPALPAGRAGTGDRVHRVRVRLAPEALQRALLSGRPDGWRRRSHPRPGADRPDWIEGSFRVDPADTALADLLALAPHVEVLAPAALRTTMADVGRRLTGLHEHGPG